MPTHPQHAKEQAKARRLQQAAKDWFGQLYPAENKLLDKAPRSQGEWALASSDKDEDNDAVKNGKEWHRNREIRSELLRWLCVDEHARKEVDPHGLNMRGARITGPLDLSYVTVPFQLLLQQCYFDEPLNLFHSEMPGLTLTGSRVPGINAGNSKIHGHLLLDEGFRCDGEVNLESTQLGGDLHCSGGTFCNPHRNDLETGELDPNSGAALTADGATFEGVVLLRRESESERTFQSEGEVRFVGAQVQGDLDCSGGRFWNLPIQGFPKSGVALNADRLATKGSIFLRQCFEAKGAVLMNDAQVGSTLDCDGGTFKNPLLQGDKIGGDALVLDRAVVKGAVLLRSVWVGECEKGRPRFSADGSVSLIATRIGGPLDLTDGDFTNATLDLSGATAPSIFDSGKKSWPKQNKLYLRLFQYGHIEPEVAEGRLQWLALQPDDDFNTESYVQLAKVLQQSGDDDGARLVLQTAAERQAKHGHPYWYLWPDNWFAASIGYGYRPIWAAGYISIMSALGWIIYRRSYLAGTLVPTDKDAYNDLKSNRSLPPHYPPLAPLILSLENSLPLVKLGQADKWQPDAGVSSQTVPPPNPLSPTDQATVEQHVGGDSLAHDKLNAERHHPVFAVRRWGRSILLAAGLQADASGRSPTSPLSRRGTSPKFLKWFVWIQILLGWLFATLFVAGYTGIVRKQ